jgi:pimeloyl-ACP methyl ester carboxylesterase
MLSSMAVFLTHTRTALSVASDRGPRDAAAVVLVHGIASSPAVFDAVIRRLSGWRIITVDLLGFGDSSAPPDSEYSIEDHAAALSATLDSLALIHGTVLVGHSLGALVAARVATMRHRRLAGVVLVSPPIYLPPSMVPAGLERRVMDLYLRGYDSLRANKRRTLTGSRVISRLLPARGILDLDERNWTAFEQSLKNSVETQTAVVDIASTRIPIEIVYGALDPFVVPELITLVGGLQHVTIHRVPRATHLIGNRLAEAVVAAITALRTVETCR